MLDQLVGTTRHSDDGLKSERTINFSPKVPDVDLNNVRTPFEIGVPHVQQDLTLGYCLAAIAHQIFE